MKVFVILIFFAGFQLALSIDGTADPDWEKVGERGGTYIWRRPIPVGLEEKDASFLCRAGRKDVRYSVGTVIKKGREFRCRYRNMDGDEQFAKDYRYLNKPDGALSWIPFGDSLSPYAIRGGTLNLNGQPTFMPVCRAVLQNNVYVGTFDEGANLCRFMSNNAVDSSAPPEETEILVTNLYGRTI